MTDTSQDNLVLSTRRRRIGAFITDHVALTFLIVSTIFLALGPKFIDESDGGKMTMTMLATMVPGFILYFAKDSIKGISIGKWIFGIMVRDVKFPNGIPSFTRLFARNLFLVVWPIELIVLASNQEKKRLGDKLTKTIVINNPNKPSRVGRIVALSGVGLAFFAFTLVFAGTAMKNSDAYKVAVQEIEQNDEIMSEIGGIAGYGIMPTGNVTISNGNGEAQLEIKVIGNEKDLIVNVYLTKRPNEEWKLIKLSK